MLFFGGGCYFSKDIRYVVYKFVGLGLFGAMLLNLGWNYPVLNSLVARGLFCFSIGVALAYFYQNEHLFNTKLIGYMCLIALIAFYVIYRIELVAIGNMQMLFILCIAPMCIICVIYVPSLNKLLSSHPFVYLGQLSLEVYLFHFSLQCVIKNIDIYLNLALNYSSRIVWTGYVVLTILVSILYKELFAEKFTKLFNDCLRLLNNKK